MKRYIRQSLYIVPCFIFTDVLSQQKIIGIVKDHHGDITVNPVLIINISTHKSSLSDALGNFVIEATENEEIRLVKEGYYRFDKKVTKEDFNTPLKIVLKKVEILIPEIKVTYKPTGNLERDVRHLDGSRKLASLKSELDDYMKSPLNEPLPKNSIPKEFGGHDFKAGQGNAFGVISLALNLITKAKKAKITKPDYNETQDFIKRINVEIDLDFLKKYGMGQEQIDRFLLYANDTRKLAKKYRKDFSSAAIEFELKVAFQEYKKTNNLEK